MAHGRAGLVLTEPILVSQDLRSGPDTFMSHTFPGGAVPLTRRELRAAGRRRRRRGLVSRVGILTALAVATVITPVAGVPDAVSGPRHVEPVYAQTDVLELLQKPTVAERTLQELSPLTAERAAEYRTAAAVRASRDGLRAAESCEEPGNSANGTAAASTVPAPRVEVVYPLNQGAYRISSSYGYRTLLGAPNQHAGVDMDAPMGSPIHAVADGVVEYAGPGKAGRSDMLIILRHELGGVTYRTWHVHMYPHGVHVQVGQQVKAGDVIGAVGSNGRSTGPHLHFEVHVDNNLTTTEPLAWLKKVGAQPLNSVTRSCL